MGIDKVPNALPNRSNIEIEIYGMEGIPEQDLKDHERQKGGAEDDEDGPMAKMVKTEGPSGTAAAGVPIMSPQVSVPSSVPLQMALPGQVAMAPPMSMAAAPLAASPFPTHAHHPGVSFGGPAHAPVITAAPMMMHARPQMIQVAQPHPQLMMAASPAAAMMSMRPQFANQGKPWPYYR